LNQSNNEIDQTQQFELQFHTSEPQSNSPHCCGQLIEHSYKEFNQLDSQEVKHQEPVVSTKQVATSNSSGVSALDSFSNG